MFACRKKRAEPGVKVWGFQRGSVRERQEGGEDINANAYTKKIIQEKDVHEHGINHAEATCRNYYKRMKLTVLALSGEPSSVNGRQYRKERPVDER